MIGPATHQDYVMKLLVATESEVYVVDAEGGTMEPGYGVAGLRPTCLAAHPSAPGVAWCGTNRSGVLRTEDGGRNWHPAGLDGRRVMALAASPAEPGTVWAGTEPSEVFCLGGDGIWHSTAELNTLPSSPTWAFPPRPETHHVRWIECHPREAGRLWAAIEAGALISTEDGGRSWRDRVPGGPYDTHEMAIHPDRPDTLRVSAGDGYYESHDGGATWARPMDGFEVGYLRSVAIDPGDPDVVLVSASSRPRSAYVAGASDGRVYRREGSGLWERVRSGWPDVPRTIAPLLLAGSAAGELWAADERGVHGSDDGGRSWSLVAAYPSPPDHLRGLTLLTEPR